MREVGRITAREARALGYTNIYAPTSTSRAINVGDESKTRTGKIRFLASRLGVEMVKGLQENYTVAATAKHYVVYSATARAAARRAPIRKLRHVKLKIFSCRHSPRRSKRRLARRDEFVQRL